MSDTKNQKPQMTPTKFLTYVGAAAVALVLTLFLLGTILTQFLWPAENGQFKVTQPKEN